MLLDSNIRYAMVELMFTGLKVLNRLPAGAKARGLFVKRFVGERSTLCQIMMVKI